MRHKYLKGVTTLSLEAEKCIGCELCAVVCPHGVFSVDGKKARIVEKDYCIECGACALNCPTQALAVNPGVGCAAAYIIGWITGGEPSCDCDSGGCC
jgi:NAD-dependent dihydropyrimidine dehydrogenase PreA subunit